MISETVAKTIEFLGGQGLMKEYEWKETANFLRICNDWFDVFNSKMKFGDKPSRHAYGMDVDKQNSILSAMSELMRNVSVGSRKKGTKLPFQKGMLLNNSSLPRLLSYLKSQYNTSDIVRIEYILTSRLNQDIIENFFSAIRAMSGGNDHPCGLEFKYRLR